MTSSDSEAGIKEAMRSAIAGLVLLVACSTPQGTGGGGSSGTTAAEARPGTVGATASLDLHDPELQEELGVPSTTDISWRRNVAGLTVVGRGTAPDPAELELLTAVMSDVPAALMRTVQPRFVVRIPEAGQIEIDPAAAAYTVGPDIYLLDRTFSITSGGSTRLDLGRAFVHELAHVAQFFSLRPEYVEAVLEERIESVDAAEGSDLVADFARATGWQDSGEPLTPRWTLPVGVQPSTTYGEAGPDEDMAEAVAMTALGRAEWISADRASWVEEWLGEPSEELAARMPWAPAGSSQVLSEQPVYDEAAVAELTTRYAHAEPLYLALPADAAPAEELASETSTRLQGRGMSGSLQPWPDQRVPRFAGLFTRHEGSAFWVELWDFRRATGIDERPEHPVLTYVHLW